MADFPASQLCSQHRPSACPSSSCVIVNGRRVPPCPGATDSESATRFGRPGRLAFILSGMQAGALKDGRFCRTAELKDSRGMSVRIAGIPSRIKGGEPRRGHGQNGASVSSLEVCPGACHTCRACEDEAWQTASLPAVLRPAASREHAGAGPALCAVQEHGIRPRKPRRPEGWHGGPDGKPMPEKRSDGGKARRIRFRRDSQTCAKNGAGTDRESKNAVDRRTTSM